MRARSSIPTGAVLAGKYRVDAVLGTGGMGIVLAATHVHLRQQVAIKLLRPEAATRRGAVERFLREARVAMRLRGEHVVRIFDVGTLDDGSPFIAMECLEGKDFGALLQAAVPLEAPLAVDYVLQAIEAIAEAHTLGVVHRDLKPANLFLTRRVDGTPCVKVLDFGVSKIAEEVAAVADLDETAPSSADAARAPAPSDVEPAVSGRDRLTGASTLLGSPRYMAPEQILSPADVDVRADIWALGAILFELLTGAPAFAGQTLEELRASVTSGPTPRAAGIAAPLQAVIHRCLARDPDGRYASAHALAEALAPFAPDGAVVVARIGRIVGVPETTSSTPLVRDLVGKRGRPATATVAVAAIAVAAAALAWAVTSRSVPADPVAAPSALAGLTTAASEPDPLPPASSAADTPQPLEPTSRSLATQVGAFHRTSRPAGSAAGAVTDAGAAPAPTSNPLHLDAGFLFRERK